MENMVSIVGILMETFAIILFIFIFSGFKFHENRKKIYIMWLFSSLFIFIVHEIPIMQKWATFAASISIICLTTFLFLKVRPLVSLLVGMLSMCLFIFFEFLSLITIDQFFNINYLSEKYYYARLIISLPHISMLIIMSIIFNKMNLSFIPKSMILRKKSSETRSHDYNKPILSTGIGLIVIVTTIFTLSYSKFYKNQSSWEIVLVVILSTLCILYFTHQNLRINVRKVENAIDKQYQEEIVNYFRLIKSQRHDFVHHLHTLHRLINKNDISSSKAYLSELMTDVMDTNESLPLAHPAMAAILLSYKQQAQARGIEVRILITSPVSMLPCRVSAFNRIIGNLFDNAIDAVLVEKDNIEERWIEITIEETTTDYRISITNSGEINPLTSSEIFNDYFTTKSGYHQGLGLSTVKRIVEQHGGLIYLEIEEGCTSFIFHLPKSN